MMRCGSAALLACLLSFAAAAADPPLTLAEALAYADAAHPDLALAEGDLAVSIAEREQASSRQDFYLYLDGTLSTGEQSGNDWRANNIGRLVALKPLLDFGRTEQAIAAADQEILARRAALLDVKSARRVDLMARYFDVLLADMQYATDNEFMAVAYVEWDNAKVRRETGQISLPQLLDLEARYQDIRERRNASLQRMRGARQKLANAMNRPGRLPSELEDPSLTGNDQALADYETLLSRMTEHNPRVRALHAQLSAVDARIAMVRADNNPTLDAEVIGAGYSRVSNTRDNLSAGLVFLIPLYQGRGVDARIARELGQKDRLAAQLEKLKIDLSEALLDTLQEIDWLRDSARAAADKQIEYRDWVLERSRAEYELELKTTLGTSMAETQAAKLRRKRVDYRLALALARLDALLGSELPPTGQKK